MKILLIFTIFLISGLVDCLDVIGYVGGSVMIYCPLSQHEPYFCKKTANQCVYLNSNLTPNTWDHKGRVTLQKSSGNLEVTYRNLSLNDAGDYFCGEKRHKIELEVKSDCCLGSKIGIQTRETASISCSYPEKFKEKPKFFYKLVRETFTPVISVTESQKGRFSISEDRSSKVLRVKISDVLEDDGGLYYCAASDDEGAARYETFFTIIHLQVQGSTSRTTSPVSTITPKPSPAPTSLTERPALPATSAPPATPMPTESTSFPGSFVMITTVSICVALLLIGGAVLVFFIVIFKKRRGSAPSDTTQYSGSTQVPAVVNDNKENTSADASTPANNSDKDPYSTLTPPKNPELTYSTVSFIKDPGSSTVASVSVSTEEPDTEYATVKLSTGLN